MAIPRQGWGLMGWLSGSSVLSLFPTLSWPAAQAPAGLVSPSHPHSSGCLESLVMWPCLRKTLPPQSNAFLKETLLPELSTPIRPDNPGIQSRLWVTSPGPAWRSDQQNLRRGRWPQGPHTRAGSSLTSSPSCWRVPGGASSPDWCQPSRVDPHYHPEPAAACARASAGKLSGNVPTQTPQRKAGFMSLLIY